MSLIHNEITIRVPPYVCDFPLKTPAGLLISPLGDMNTKASIKDSRFIKRVARVAVVAPFTAWVLCAQAEACSRSDIDYYLGKGFTHEQVAALCGSGSPPDNDRRRYEEEYDPPEREAEGRRQREEEVAFMKNAIGAWDIELTPIKLEYTRKFCISAGKTPEVEGRTRLCPDVRYRIYFKGLDVGNYERKYFFLGRREIEVSGKIKRKLLHDLREYPSDLKRQLLAAYKNAGRDGGTFVPVRRDVPIHRVVDILRKYARFATAERGAG